MANFRFLHAADIHLDSPLHGLSRYEGVSHAEVRGATRAAFDNLVSLALDQRVDFVVIAGDLFDGNWKDMGTGLYFTRAMGRLAQGGIPVFLLSGNHDAESVLTKDLPLQETVRRFSNRKPETYTLDDLGVALHGQGFATAHVTDNLAQAYPSARSGMFNIGLLHTALTGHPEHAPYAPCSIADLAGKGYDYWALGHVHDHAVMHDAPHVVFPGNLQGRNIRETGPKGAVMVDVVDRTVVSIVHHPLDVVRWARVTVDCADLEAPDDVLAGAKLALAQTYADASDGRPLVARLTFVGATPLHDGLQDRQGGLRDDVRALAAHVSPDLWIEKVVVRTTAPTVQAETMSADDDFIALLEEARTSPALAEALAADLATFLTALPPDEATGEDDPLSAVRRQDWAGLIDAGAAALRARLVQDAA